MYILSKLSWHHDGDRKIQPLVEGYYDSAHRWNEISVFYMDYYQIWDLIAFYEKHPEFDRILTMDRATDTLIMIYQGITRIPSQRIILPHGRLPAIVWPINFEKGYFDENVNEDDRIFTSVDIQDAVIYGITKGVTAGREGLELIEGQSPIDCAILYSKHLEGA